MPRHSWSSKRQTGQSARDTSIATQSQSKLVMASCLQHETHCHNFSACRKSNPNLFGLWLTEKCCTIKSARQRIEQEVPPVNSNSQAGSQTTSDEPSHANIPDQSLSTMETVAADYTLKGLAITVVFFPVGLSQHISSASEKRFACINNPSLCQLLWHYCRHGQETTLRNFRFPTPSEA